MRRTYTPKLTTAQRGYGYEHQKARRAFVEAFTSGDPCARCDEPMVGDVSLFDLDHTDDRTGYLGLSHRECNRRVNRRRAGGRVSVCDYCGLEYRARWADQVYCSVPCQKAARRARTEQRVATAKAARLRPCDICHITLTRTKRCSEECRAEWNRRNMRDRYRAAHGLWFDPNQPTKVWGFEFSGGPSS